MKTPEEIKKGLKCCIKENCEGCPYVSNCMAKTHPLESDVLAYIRYLERERNAAIKDAKSLCASSWDGNWCKFCTYNEPDGQCYRECLTGGCAWGHGWEWRGVQDDAALRKEKSI